MVVCMMSSLAGIIARLVASYASWSYVARGIGIGRLGSPSALAVATLGSGPEGLVSPCLSRVIHCDVVELSSESSALWRKGDASS